jgi:hypothetical protein
MWPKIRHNLFIVIVPMVFLVLNTYTEPFQPGIEKEYISDLLVVEGQVTDEAGHFRVKLSRPGNCSYILTRSASKPGTPGINVYSIVIPTERETMFSGQQPSPRTNRRVIRSLKDWVSRRTSHFAFTRSIRFVLTAGNMERRRDRNSGRVILTSPVGY